MNEIIRDQPDRTAARMAQYIQDIEDLKQDLNEKESELAYFHK